MVSSPLQVIQVPEVCTWNPYVELGERSLVAHGVEVLRPGLCMDGPFTAPASPPQIDPAPDIVHLHWPEILADWYGTDRALALLRELVRLGTNVIQTVHDLHPHPFEATPELLEFLHEVDGLTSGAHFFTPDHERLARAARTRLPALTTHLVHPAFGNPFEQPGPVVDRQDGPVSDRRGEAVLGCFGRIRPDKGYIEFARVFSEVAAPAHRLLVAGAPIDDEIDRHMREIADADPRITYLGDFHSEEKFTELFRDVDWVALPYERIFSSGVLVKAVEAGKPIVARDVTGADEYGLRAGLLVIEPWDNATALRRWMDVAHDPSWMTSGAVLPSWHDAASKLVGFYRRAIYESSRTAGTGRTP